MATNKEIIEIQERIKILKSEKNPDLKECILLLEKILNNAPKSKK